ncbi:LysR family transcriptional regulator [Agrobacterium rhizogenes]|uniref:HTH lysR-type domain-containing protein n=1 Tax=Rhizobium rhizogenes NBRC 13257 TaxID=1220581 RepID=A0AA87QEI0_RHIRH|nr:LysR family transcriptional regulator [Agrobacterium sp. ICMP 7243]MQB34979.1 LysR family transcriptional regulator [Rhizobium rhizogenes]GAJ96921.1 hypothetical protein RRH01S_27_00470 [Rhizobium rhizogenes NBRC 13257]NTF52610.1 LysR family transcriptional regulator [Rhizobium rhizogenes]NTF59140.1 LysR family transcriptional regulator [Rhizobium rhizogenes]
MDNRAGEAMVFVQVAEAGSFSEAARLLMMTPSTVSRYLACRGSWRASHVGIPLPPAPKLCLNLQVMTFTPEREAVLPG